MIELPLHRTGLHDCAYLDGRAACTAFIDPATPIDGPLYERLLEQGFRRSGRFIYRPACPHCRACIPVRLPVAEFRPDRSQRRNGRRNAVDISVVDTPARFDSTHAALYRRYLLRRHADRDSPGETDAGDDHYRRFLVEPWGGTTRLLEFRLGRRLLGVAVTDVLDRGLSAVYTFFDPDEQARGPGTFAILAQIALARRLDRRWLYLGYWIRDSVKMAYKSRFRPLDAWDGRAWHRLPEDA